MNPTNIIPSHSRAAASLDDPAAASARWPSGRCSATPPGRHVPERCRTSSRAPNASSTCSMSGGPSHIDLFDYKPVMRELHGEELPESVRGRAARDGDDRRAEELPGAGAALRKFKQHGESGAWVSELLPWTARIARHSCASSRGCTPRRSTTTPDHLHQHRLADPGKPSAGPGPATGWGARTGTCLPTSSSSPRARARDPGQPIFLALWGRASCPPVHQGVLLRSGDPVLYLQGPAGRSPARTAAPSSMTSPRSTGTSPARGDPEIETRISQYEMAFRMQAAAPGNRRPLQRARKHLRALWRGRAQPGTYAYNCLLARRMAEREVRLMQLFHRGWDQHGSNRT